MMNECGTCSTIFVGPDTLRAHCIELNHLPTLATTPKRGAAPSKGRKFSKSDKRLSKQLSQEDINNLSQRFRRGNLSTVTVFQSVGSDNSIKQNHSVNQDQIYDLQHFIEPLSAFGDLAPAVNIYQERGSNSTKYFEYQPDTSLFVISPNLQFPENVTDQIFQNSNFEF